MHSQPHPVQRFPDHETKFKNQQTESNFHWGRSTEQLKHMVAATRFFSRNSDCAQDAGLGFDELPDSIKRSNGCVVSAL